MGIRICPNPHCEAVYHNVEEKKDCLKCFDCTTKLIRVNEKTYNSKFKDNWFQYDFNTQEYFRPEYTEEKLKNYKLLSRREKKEYLGREFCSSLGRIVKIYGYKITDYSKEEQALVDVKNGYTVSLDMLKEWVEITDKNRVAIYTKVLNSKGPFCEIAEDEGKPNVTSGIVGLDLPF